MISLKKIGGVFILLLILKGELLAKGTPSALVLLERAEKFRLLGLPTLAREQYLYIQRKYPKEKNISKALAELSREESRRHELNGLNAQKAGALKLASLEFQKAMKMNPSDSELRKKHLGVMNELKLKKGLNDRVSKEYLMGLEHYQAGRLDRALEYFVKVINMAPAHKGAFNYIEKIGRKLGKVKDR